MHGAVALAFLNLGVPEAIVIGILVMLLFGPKAARAMGNLGRILLDVKKDIDDTKRGIARQIKNEVDATVYGRETEEDTPSKPKRK